MTIGITGIELSITISSLREAFYYIRKKLKDNSDVILLAKAIKDMSICINSYFILYGYALDIYTTADDSIKGLLISTEEVVALYSEANFNNLCGKFEAGLQSFLLIHEAKLDKYDISLIREYTSQLDQLFGKGNICLQQGNYKELRAIIYEIAKVSNKLRGLSRERLLSLIDGLGEAGANDGARDRS